MSGNKILTEKQAIHLVISTRGNQGPWSATPMQYVVKGKVESFFIINHTGGTLTWVVRAETGEILTKLGLNSLVTPSRILERIHR
ncbi:hypothetical protein COV24_04975 [candidate division WWE3 bacterium CG10_big_fil_rev_8_21_14_0_10_32_10]|uniref:Uncharacterized protein n=1 Tax=candidate division WWE3 bacterium CG10_big_fil_rev_8_21_14_0_10_32_10 TaxID=1975090 RepID=A0A2H0R8X6_UNCKA|nr:MAG: hypothetical protein COV24_04975 [candidate division WWE3 bacterium CG10_big_fil_rev_8_21_14_0_10_32_10]